MTRNIRPSAARSNPSQGRSSRKFVVVVLTNRPGRVKSIIPVELKRPPPAELAIAPEFRDIYSRIWSDLKDEVREFE